MLRPTHATHVSRCTGPSIALSATSVRVLTVCWWLNDASQLTRHIRRLLSLNLHTLTTLLSTLYTLPLIGVCPLSWWRKIPPYTPASPLLFHLPLPFPPLPLSFLSLHSSHPPFLLRLRVSDLLSSLSRSMLSPATLKH